MSEDDLAKNKVAGGPTTTASSSTAAAAAKAPFDDFDFAQAQKRRERAKAAKEGGGHNRDEAEQPLVANMDADGASSIEHQQGKKAKRPNLVKARAKTTGSSEPAASGGGGERGRQKKTFFGFGKGTGDSSSIPEENYSNHHHDAVIYEESFMDMKPITVGNRKLAIWPYDDYHLVQKLYYEKLGAAEARRGRTLSAVTEDHDDDDETKEPDRDATKTMMHNNNNKSHAHTPDSSIPIFSRPADPPDIPTAVQGLSLTAFEGKAEERAIAIVSTWLFDAGLIDELLVNGGMTGFLLPSSTISDRTSGNINTSSVGDDKSVQTTSEGVEVGSHGYPIEGGGTKMDKEVAKLRNSTKRQLALINARLNDGVAATGSEVQELVHAVVSTKEDIGRLRELSSYVSNAAAGGEETSHEFMLTKYPKLKQAINARRNLARCFRELDFFAQIPITCDRLREELHAGEWTAHEWSSLRSVAREHVELEIFLVEAEAGMKKRLQEEEMELAKKNSAAGNRRGSTAMANQHFGRNAFEQRGLGGNANNTNTLIDRFLEEQVQNVWELGDEIRLRIMSGIASAFDLAMNNPAGMVALVEAVEVYEMANADYLAVHGEAAFSSRLRFTDMRAAAVAELYKDFETRGLDVFRELTTQAADVAEEDEAANKQFSAVLRASNELASEISIVKEQMAPCFPPNWAVATLWTTCVAHVCSTNILQQIGGPDGQKLPDLTVTQLLDLVAWVENFREIIEDAFPDIGEITSSKTYLDRPPKLLQENSKTIDITLARDSLAWVNNTLWEVHDLAKDEFLLRTTEQTEAWLNNVYEADHSKSQTADGRLVTSLCEDVYSLAGVQLRTIRERLTRRSEALVQAVGVIFKNLYEKQTKSRDLFCTDFETCCAASNDFVRMSDKCEEIIAEIQEESDLSAAASETLEEQTAAILGLYSADAVYAAKKTHVYCFEPIEEAIANELFGEEWETELTHNELALTLVRTLDDFMEDLETFLDELMVQKAVEAQISSSVIFYIRCLLTKASKHNSNKKGAFTINESALTRMRGDSVVLREYFDGLAESMPTLSRAVENEFSLLESVFEIIAIAAGLSNADLHDFVLVLQKRLRNFPLTRLMVGDLYHLVNPAEERNIYELIDGMEEDMATVAPTDEKAAQLAQDRNTVPGLRIDDMVAHHCDQSKRNRPGLKPGTMEALRTWRSSWGGEKVARRSSVGGT